MTDIDVDTMLDQALEVKKEVKSENGDDNNRKRRSSDDDDDKSRSKRRKRSRSPARRERSRSREKGRSRDRSRERRRRSSSRDRYRRDDDRDRRRSPPRYDSRDRDRPPRRPRSPTPPSRRSYNDDPVTSGGRRLPGPERRDVMPFTASKEAPRGCKTDLSQEERDQRTIFVMQLANRTRPRELEDFFSAVGTVRDVRIITDSKTRRSKGIAYVEFWEVEAVPLALGLNGQKLIGAPLVIQPTQAERNRAFNGMSGMGNNMPTSGTTRRGPMKLYVGSLHTNIEEDMLRGIFEPFGTIEQVQLLRDDNGVSRGYAFVTFRLQEDGRRALEQLNGFELAGRPIKVGMVNDASTQQQESKTQVRSLESEEMDRAGVDLGTTGRLALMAKLAEGTGLSLPSQAQQILSNSQHSTIAQSTAVIATQCFMLSNMFDLNNEPADKSWETDVRDDVIEECSRFGGVLHVFVDKTSQDGNVYVKCSSINAAVNSVQSLHGRWFAGKVITANYVPVPNYHQLFPECARVTEPLQPSYATAAAGNQQQAGNIY